MNQKGGGKKGKTGRIRALKLDLRFDLTLEKLAFIKKKGDFKRSGRKKSFMCNNIISCTFCKTADNVFQNEKLLIRFNKIFLHMAPGYFQIQISFQLVLMQRT